MSPVLLHLALVDDPLGETDNDIVRIADHNNISFGVLFTPLFDPQIQNIVQIDVRQKWRDHRSLRYSNGRCRPLAIVGNW